MPHLKFEINFSVSNADKRVFAAKVKEHFAVIMDTGVDHTAVTVRCFGPHDLSFGHATADDAPIAFVNADIRDGRSRDQKRELSLALIEELHLQWQVPRSNIYVILTEHPGEHFQLHDRTLPAWSEGEDPLAD